MRRKAYTALAVSLLGCGRENPPEPPSAGAATQLFVRTQPGGATSGRVLAPQPVIEVRDANNNIVLGFTAAVTAALSSGGGTLAGTTSVNAAAGVATFTDLAITGPAGARTLVFSASGLASATSAPFNIVADSPLAARRYAEAGTGSIRLVRDPVSGLLYVLRLNGTIARVVPNASGASVEQVYTPSTTGVPSPQGLAFGPDGTMYLVGDQISTDNLITATVRRGVRTSATSDTRSWSTVAHTVPYQSSGFFDHHFNGIVVSTDNRWLYVNSGARTDHGEIESNGGRFPGVREVALTSMMLRLPVSGDDILLPNDDAALRALGVVFARGLRNAFDPAFSAVGELFVGDNSGDRDDSDELNWVQEGRHYGFPWRMGRNDTPQQFPGYDPATDRMINHAYTNWQQIFSNDLTYPARPATPFTDPIPNTGPDANSVRDPATGIAVKASAAGGTAATFTSHRAPLGLVFDVRNELPDRFRGSAFILGFTKGSLDPSPASQGPFLDQSEDVLQLVLTGVGDTHQVSATRLVCGFSNPIDAEIMNGRLYVLEFGTGAVWEISLPTGSEATKSGCVSVR